MQKKYIVRLSKQERHTLREVVKKLKGSGEKVRRAQVLLKADVDGPAWNDSRIAEAFGCRRQTVKIIRQRFVESGFQETLEGKKRAKPPTEKLLDGEQEAKIIATRLGRKRPAEHVGGIAGPGRRGGRWRGERRGGARHNTRP